LRYCIGPQAAIAAIRDHLGRTIARVEDLRREYPDYFA